MLVISSNEQDRLEYLHVKTAASAVSSLFLAEGFEADFQAMIILLDSGKWGIGVFDEYLVRVGWLAWREEES